jgi:aminoglycoside N3'-acetyltransferase
MDGGMLDRNLSLDDFRGALDEVIADGDDFVVLYAGIWQFGHRFGLRPEALLDCLIAALLNRIGPRRTLVVPAYVSNFPETRKFDLIRSLAYTGVIANRLLQHSQAIRTAQPMDSYVAIGPHARDISALPCTTAWGDDGVMGFFDTVDARQVILGVPWHSSCSHCHRCEEVVGVPYRYYKRFAGRLLNNGEDVGPCQEVMYVRPRRVDPMLDYSPIRRRLAEVDAVRFSESCPELMLESASSRDITRHSCDLVRENPLVFVNDRDAIKAWIADDREAEIAGLVPDERFVGRHS